ncbi:DeoR/GlpR family DNA-binding transcription regulator [Falsihalocynthiibacter arcticus]|uniref:DeoR family transcriptional regulator n=1 Tax=Falsihalocynthiibacter arcticus TaxID=1579316 RepID=A0A126V1Q6_9RHOB|nr:DeoR/GlpR family DNA-binding transcription regulator [Falsihalocynthiibacter arcticus]AML51619.1 DeoR family transcriptional regulator [Falsihalocynthiibacter arcticus]
MSSDSDLRNLGKTDRHTQILLELRLAPHVRVADLAAKFGVTTETVRRDIAELSNQGLLQKSHGGASPCASGTYRALDQRQGECVKERQQLAHKAATLVKDGQTLMIDAGSTAMEFARALAIIGRQVTVVTNSLQVAMILGTSDSVNVIVAPGRYLNDEAALVGTETCSFLRRYHVDACYLSASALGEMGVSESIDGFGSVKRTMLEQSSAQYFLIDGSKFGKRHLLKVADISEIGNLVTDREPSGELAQALKKQNIKIILS